MLRRHSRPSGDLAKSSGLPPLPFFEVTLTDDRHTFDGGDGEVTVDGFDVDRHDGSPMYLSDDGPVDERVFYFRIAGVMHHQVGAQSTAFAPLAQVFLQPEPTNPQDPNAVRVTGQDGSFAGYAPRAVAAVLSQMLSHGGRVCMGIVTKTYGTSRGRNAVEVLVTCDRNIEARADVGDDRHYKPRLVSGYVQLDDSQGPA